MPTPKPQPHGVKPPFVSADWLSPAPGVAYGLLLILSLPLIFWGSGRYGVVGADEAFYQDIAINMLESGNWFRLQSGSYAFIYDTFANAPLQYWVRGLVVSHLGDTYLAMRLVSGVCALLAVLATHRFVELIADRRAAFLAALILLTNFQFLYLHSARTGELEPIVCLLLVLTAHAFVRAIQDPSRSWLGHHVCLALLLNVKAPVIPIPLVAEAVCFVVIPIARRRAVDWLKLGVLVLPIASTWHILQAIEHREALATLYESVRHQASGDFVKGGAGTFYGRVLYYARCVLFGAFPSLLLLPPTLISLLRSASGSSGDDPRVVAALRVLLIYPLATIGFYLAISKIGPWYVIHAYPFLAAWVGIWLSRLGGRAVSSVALAWVSVALSLLFWLQPDMSSYNPFATDAIRIPMKTSWRELPGLLPQVGIPLLTSLMFVVLLWGRRAWQSDFGRILTSLLVILFVGVALARSLAPLTYIDHLSPIAAMAADLDERKAAGQPIPYPIELPPSHPWVVNYYFWRDHEVRLLPGSADPRNPSASRFLLIRERVHRPDAIDRARRDKPANTAE